MKTRWDLATQLLTLGILQQASRDLLFATERHCFDYNGQWACLSFEGDTFFISKDCLPYKGPEKVGRNPGKSGPCLEDVQKHECTMENYLPMHMFFLFCFVFLNKKCLFFFLKKWTRLLAHTSLQFQFTLNFLLTLIEIELTHQFTRKSPMSLSEFIQLCNHYHFHHPKSSCRLVCYYSLVPSMA
jgi:hypothetical protein